MKKLKIYLLLSLFIFTILFFTNCNYNSNINKYILNVHFIDVGQGDSILIQFNNKNLLIDSGSRCMCNKTLNYIKNQGVKTLDYVIATHPHEDHIGCMDKIINEFNVKSFYAPRVSTNTEEFKYMIKELKRKNLTIHSAFVNKHINIDPKLTCKFIAPNSKSYDNINNYSGVIKLTYNKCSFIFTGDAEKISENEMINNINDLSCDVLKLGHHGSKTSSTEDFLNKTNPKVAVISCGYNNKYNHPNKIVLKRLMEHNIKILRTDLHGNIILKCDGSHIKRVVFNKK